MKTKFMLLKVKYLFAIFIINTCLVFCYSEEPQSEIYIIDDDFVTITTFAVDINLTDNAEKLIREKNCYLQVFCYLSGAPIKNWNFSIKKYLDFMGDISLINTIELYDSRTAVFNNIQMPIDVYNNLSNKDMELVINIVTKTENTNVNILNCEIFQGKLSEIVGTKISLKGKLISE